MPTSYGILAFRKIPIARSEKCLIRSLPLPECTTCLGKLEETSEFLKPLAQRVLQSGELQLLCILRRDTHALVDLLRGRYGSLRESSSTSFRESDEEREKMLSIWMNETTCTEKKQLRTMSFHEIWNKMFRRRPSLHQEQLHSQLMQRNEQHKDEALVQRNKSVTATNSTQNSLFASQNDGTPMEHHPFPEFGIPKGRYDRKDRSTLDCAIREFVEETGYRKEHLKFREMKKFTEEFIGTNGVPYIHVYWLAEIDSNIEIPEMTPQQLGEIQNVGWFTQEEIVKVLRKYDTAKKKVILEAFDYMRRI